MLYMETRSIQTAFRFRPQMLAQMKNKARLQGVSLNSYVENLVQKDIDGQESRYEEIYRELSKIKINPETLEKIHSDIQSLNIHISQEDIDSDERIAYLLSK